MVKLYRFHGNGHTSRQATEPVPHFRPHLCRAHRRPSDAVAVHLRAAVSCTRFASFHKSRIMVLALGWRFSAARASRGRNRFDRLTNRVISPLKLCGVDLVKGFAISTTQTSCLTPLCLGRGLTCPGRTCGSCPSRAPLSWIGSPVGQHSWTASGFRGALCRRGLSSASATAATFKRLRRFLPTSARSVKPLDPGWSLRPGRQALRRAPSSKTSCKPITWRACACKREGQRPSNSSCVQTQFARKLGFSAGLRVLWVA